MYFGKLKVLCLTHLFSSLVVVSFIFASTVRTAVSEDPVKPLTYALSPMYLKFLSKQERGIYNGMKEYSESLERRLELIKRYTRDYELTTLEGTKFLFQDEEKDQMVADNPILAFRMLSRLAHEFASVGRHLSENTEEASPKILLDTRGEFEFPTPGDVRDAMDAILRFQFVYDLKAQDIADGKLDGRKSLGNPVGLNTKQCFAFGKAAKRNFQYTLALDWFNVTSSKLATEPNALNKFSDHTLKTAISATVAEHDEEHESNLREGYEHIYATRIGPADLKSGMPTRIRDLFEADAPEIMLNETDPRFYQRTHFNHLALCRGSNFQTKFEKLHLSCWNDHNRHPYWKVNPLRIELLNQSPTIILIHDFVGEKMMKVLRELSYPTLERAPVGPMATPRTAAYAWLKDSELKGIQLSRRIEFVTGLNVVGEKASELLQIAAYSFGGHVDLHYDSKGPDDPIVDPKGDRLMTVLIYLNDVHHGGTTSFPKLGFGVKPKMGSAILWYTNLRNGQLDPLTLHGACPLISGHKWIATKWIHINENYLKRPCALDPTL